MRTLSFLLSKEFRQIFRNRALLPMIFISPVIQLIIMPLAADFEIKNINISIVDHDHSPYSRQLINKIAASGYFVISDYGNSYHKAFQQFETDRSDLILEIPQGFERNLVRENEQTLFVAVNAINGVKATVGNSYLGRIVGDFNNDIRLKFNPAQGQNTTPVIEVSSINRFNPTLNYPFFMVPGILVSLVTMVGVYMCSLNVVKEKEIGTIEQINVTPVKKYHFILGKMIPFWVIGMFIFSVGLFAVGRLIFGIVPAGSILLLYGFLSIYLIAVLGLGLLISTYSETQQQAMSLAFFCIMIFMLMSGLFTPVDSMPTWAIAIARCSPVTYFIEVMRMVVLKGSGFEQVKYHFLVILGFAVLFNSWAVWNYRKVG
jgi:ABC-2 type transport system permease protein